jgi:hypothetical protein
MRGHSTNPAAIEAEIAHLRSPVIEVGKQGPHRQRPTAWLTMQSITNRSPAPKSLLTGKLTGNFAESGPSIAIFASEQRADSIAYSRIPYATEQGIFAAIAVNPWA